ncbi:hypothetical protein ACFPRL_36165 [Pseudoclavibacter helvolus]
MSCRSRQTSCAPGWHRRKTTHEQVNICSPELGVRPRLPRCRRIRWPGEGVSDQTRPSSFRIS